MPTRTNGAWGAMIVEADLEHREVGFPRLEGVENPRADRSGSGAPGALRGRRARLERREEVPAAGLELIVTPFWRMR